MKITKLSLTDFRGFRAFTLELADARIALFIGQNGAGKSSVLDAAAIALTRVTAELKAYGAGRRPIQPTDINNQSNTAQIDIAVEHGSKSYAWSIVRQGRGAKKDGGKHMISKLEEVKQLASDLLDGLDNECIPLLAYYPVNRAVLDIPLKIRVLHDFSPLGAFEKALTSAADFRMFFEWFRNREDFENEKKVEDATFCDPVLNAVRSAIYAFMEGFKNLRVQRRPLRMTIDKGEQEVFINQLSDGEKCLLALIGDLARRLAIANPGLNSPLEGHGVVLIDEIELHLHPAWQRTVIPCLNKTFPNCQFLISTHSPQILGGAKNAKVFVVSEKKLNDSESEQPLIALRNLYGIDSNRILGEVMGAGTRAQEVSDLFAALFAQIEYQNWNEVTQIVAQLESMIEREDPELLKANLLIQRRRYAAS